MRRAIARLARLNRTLINGRITDSDPRRLDTLPVLSRLEIRSSESISQAAVEQLKDKLPCLSIVQIKPFIGG